MNKRTSVKTLVGGLLLLASQGATAADVTATISIKQPGNKAVTYKASDAPTDKVSVRIVTEEADDEEERVVAYIDSKSDQPIYYSLQLEMEAGFSTFDTELYMPGFWYHRNLRSPREAPSFHTSKAWRVREDRLSAPLVGAYSTETERAVTVMHLGASGTDALTTHQEGEVILSGETSLGYVGFDCEGEETKLCFGYPYMEAPRRYIRKLTLAEPIQAFARLNPGERKVLTWMVCTNDAENYGQFVGKAWTYCFDRLQPQPVKALYSPSEMKATLANYFRHTYVDRFPLKFNSGHGLHIERCDPVPIVQVGFCGRVLLNGFNALEYGEQTKQQDLVDIGRSIFDSWQEHGLTKRGYFWDNIHYDRDMPTEESIVHSIRQQSEGVYAVLHYLAYEKSKGRKHKEWERKMRTLLDNLLTLQKADGSFARKYHDDGTDIDASGGSTPSATSTLVMGYKYFGDKRYLEAAKRTVGYLEENIISKSDYFSSTLDANCEDKEAAISAVTATYYLAMVTKGQERQHYIDLCQQAMYFALSWYYLWDVPFAQGQMLGDLGFQSRGWGNVSVENNHVDVFVFELGHIAKWLGEVQGEPRFTKMYELILSSLNQLLPVPERLCGIGVKGLNPEVVQHTAWDYGRNGKGFYNDIFAPGWTVASLWELYSPNRTANFLK